MKKQFVVLGLGSFGASVAVTLQKLGCDVVAVDQDMELVTDIAEKVTYAMQADIENPKLLESLGSKNFDGMVVASSENLEGSILATLAAKEMGIPYILCKAHDERHARVLRKIGADAVVFPEEEMGRKINVMSLSYNRLMNHVRYMAARVLKKESLKLSMNDYMKVKFPESYKIAEKVCEQTGNRLKCTLEEAEIGYLAMHIERVTSGELDA